MPVKLLHQYGIGKVGRFLWKRRCGGPQGPARCGDRALAKMVCCADWPRQSIATVGAQRNGGHENKIPHCNQIIVAFELEAINNQSASSDAVWDKCGWDFRYENQNWLSNKSWSCNFFGFVQWLLRITANLPRLVLAT